ncbi:MAG TPA: aminotransferase class V-fold PLP-dependent enzyme [Actinophytocola sp.]|uniref:kynureninase n=1 Tax=Actinophytocola sp. TaxID=1872138 RepID=UPI002DDCC034|nr:aminotransferase class V-fold PLP-dependent enzyme [Actinophytocola sp.]HEV2778872.1 aminotransferase class V-fold PLP-dependent enzyme [Actinophytocola sp.]
MTAISLDDARRLDRDDELAAYRERFVPIDPGVVAYLDGNSLGRPPQSTMDRLEDLVVRQWGSRLIRSWEEGWLELPERIGDRLGAACLGAAAGQVIVADSTTLCLHKALRAAIALRPGRTEIVTDAANFPTDRYVVEAVAEELGLTVRWVPTDLAAGITAEALAGAVGERTAVVTLSHVAYRSSYLADLAAITELVHAAGALVVWDLCHSAGVVPVHLDAAGADFAVGCTYKFLNAGPGAPAFLYVRAEHLPGLRAPLRGWMGTEDIFDMDAAYRPASGLRRLLSGTPAVLGLLCVAEGLAMIADAGIERIRAKSTALTRLAIELADAWLAPLGFTVASPRADERRGGHVLLSHPNAANLARLFNDSGVILDFRPPQGIRLGPSPLSTSYEEVWTALNRMRALTAAGSSTVLST